MPGERNTVSDQEIDKIRGLLMAAGWSTQRIADHFGIGRSGVYNVIYGASTSGRIRDFISKRIGYWPSGWAEKG